MKVTEHIEYLLKQGKKSAELTELGFPKRLVTRVNRRLRGATSGRTGGKKLKKSQQPPESPPMGDKMAEETPETATVPETYIILSQRLDTLGKAVYELADTYALNEAAKEKGQGAIRVPPCPECLMKGEPGFIWAIKRKTTPKDRIEYIESIENAKELDDEEEEKERLLKLVPTHIVEAKCQKCGHTEFIGYD